MQAAFLRPMGLLVVVIGAVFFAATLAWWIVPLTLATYVALVFLAARDPIFRSRVLEGRERPSGLQPGLSRDQVVSPERRARWLTNRSDLKVTGAAQVRDAGGRIVGYEVDIE